VTKTARAMVTRFGMSERLGPRTFGHKEELIFLGREISEQRDYSEKIAEEIDSEVRRIIDHAHDLARKIISENRNKLDHLARTLMEIETLEGEALIALLARPTRGRQLRLPGPWRRLPPPARSPRRGPEGHVGLAWAPAAASSSGGFRR
jgi:cell division protease FtsH